eukprot:SAG31_NODE_4886_length_2885_cov_2.277459_3_plen_369_part_00
MDTSSRNLSLGQVLPPPGIHAGIGPGAPYSGCRKRAAPGGLRVRFFITELMAMRGSIPGLAATASAATDRCRQHCGRCLPTAADACCRCIRTTACRPLLLLLLLQLLLLLPLSHGMPKCKGACGKRVSHDGLYRKECLERIKLEASPEEAEKILAEHRSVREQVSKQFAKYRKQNAVQLQAYQDKYREQNAEKISQAQLKYREQNAEKISQARSAALLATKLAASAAAPDEAETMLARDSPEMQIEVERQFQLVVSHVERLKATDASAPVYINVGNTAKLEYTQEVARSLYQDSCPLRDRSNAMLVKGPGDTNRLKKIGFEHHKLNECYNNENCNSCKSQQHYTFLSSLFSLHFSLDRREAGADPSAQ